MKPAPPVTRYVKDEFPPIDSSLIAGKTNSVNDYHPLQAVSSLKQCFPFGNILDLMRGISMFKNLMFRTRKLLFKGVVLASLMARHGLNFTRTQEFKNIPLERQRRALATTVDF